MSENTISNFLLSPFPEISTSENRLHMVLDDSNAEQLRAYLGQNAYEEYVAIARKTLPKFSGHLGAKTPKNLIFIPGIMGSYLKSETVDSIWWIDLRTRNYIDSLKLAPNGEEDANSDYQIIPCTTDPSYDPFKFAVLRQNDFGLVPFPYDWRKPLELSTSILRDKILETYEKNGKKAVHLVAHSMGGLLVRATLMNYGQQLWSKVGKIVFIGTPHYGSPAIASYLKNHLWGSYMMALLGRYITPETFRSLWGALSLLPAPAGIYPGTRAKDKIQWTSKDSDDSYIHPCINFDMYQADNWKLNLSSPKTYELQQVLDEALDFHKRMYQAHRALDQRLRDRMVVIAGVGFKTLFRIACDRQFFGLWERMNKVTNRIPGNPYQEGDGSVPLASAALEYVGEIRYVKGEHGALPNIPQVYQDVFRWLKGESMKLPKTPSGALGSHLAGGTGVSEAPHLDGTTCDFNTDDLGRWQLETLDSNRLDELETQLEAGQLPEFTKVRLL